MLFNNNELHAIRLGMDASNEQEDNRVEVPFRVNSSEYDLFLVAMFTKRTYRDWDLTQMTRYLAHEFKRN